MNQFYRRLATESVWYPEYHPTIRSVPVEWARWLLDKSSLTERLIEHSDNQFQVKVLSQRWAMPRPHEAAKLNIPLHLAARVREVELYCGDLPVVFARSVMPLKMYLQQRQTLQNIGTRPLGQLLFRDGTIRVSKRDLALFSGPNNSITYGRCTPYRYYGGQILVSEFFISDSLIEQNIS